MKFNFLNPAVFTRQSVSKRVAVLILLQKRYYLSTGIFCYMNYKCCRKLQAGREGKAVAIVVTGSTRLLVFNEVWQYNLFIFGKQFSNRFS